MYPTLVVFAGYLAAEIFLGGYPAAAAVFMLGVGEFFFLLIFKQEKHPSLIAEGAVLAGAGLAGEALSAQGYSGGGLVLIELLLGSVLLISALRGKPWLAGQMKRFAGFSGDREFAGAASRVMGMLFLVHGVVMAVLVILKGRIVPLPAIASFVLLYLLSFVYLRKKQRVRARRNAPVLLQREEGGAALKLAGRELGTMQLKPGRATLVSDIEISEGVEIDTFLDNLELFLKMRGCRALRLQDWKGPDLPLEMSGYRKSPTGWSKPL